MALYLEHDTTFVMRLVNTCKIEPCGGDAAKQVVSYTEHNLAIFIDLIVTECVVGHVCVGTMSKCWGIINCSGDYKQTVFAENVLWKKNLNEDM